MPTFRKKLRCQFCSHEFIATIRTHHDDGPDTEYVVYCPENGSRLKVRRRELTEAAEEPLAAAVEATPPKESPREPEPWQPDPSRLIFALVVLLLAAAGTYIAYMLW